MATDLQRLALRLTIPAVGLAAIIIFFLPVSPRASVLFSGPRVREHKAR